METYTYANSEEMSNMTMTSSEEFSPHIWESVTFILMTSLCICATVVGNVLVILSVFTYRPLNSVQNYFIVSLAVADLTVALLVMPLNVANYVIGHWVLGEVLCNLWLTLDILCCTASILNLCAIALDRYYAIHDPITYAQKRTTRRVVLSIALAWLLSAVISVPPLIGWNNSNGRSLYDQQATRCRLTDSPSFVLYSAVGSFFGPLLLMTFAYVKIFQATRQRLLARAKASISARLASVRAQTLGDSSVAISIPQAAELSSGEYGNDVPLKGMLALEATARLMVGVQSVGRTYVQHQLSQGQGQGQQRQQQGQSLQAQELPVPPLQARNHLQHQPQQRKRSSQTQSNGSTGKGHGHGHRSSSQGTVAAAAAAAVASSSSRKQVSSQQQKISLSKERRAARTMAIIMFSFVACWLPFFSMYVTFAYFKQLERQASERLVNFIVWLGYFNSALNPVIYTVFNTDFRASFQRLLGGQLCWSRS